MPRPTAIASSLNRAFKEASNRIVLEALAGLTPSTEMGRVVDEFSRSAYKEEFRSLTLGEVVQALAGGGGATPERAARPAKRGRPAGKKTTPSSGTGRSYRTRTAAGREQIDAGVMEFLNANGKSAAEDIRRQVGGSPNQIRESLKRMITDGIVVREGQKRLTRYAMRGSGAASSSTPGRKKAGRPAKSGTKKKSTRKTAGRKTGRKAK